MISVKQARAILHNKDLPELLVQRIIEANVRLARLLISIQTSPKEECHV